MTPSLLSNKNLKVIIPLYSLKPSNYQIKTGSVNSGGGNPICEQPDNSGCVALISKRANLNSFNQGSAKPIVELKGNGTSTLGDTSIQGSTLSKLIQIENQKAFLNFAVSYSKWYVSCIYDYQLHIYTHTHTHIYTHTPLLEDHHGNEQSGQHHVYNTFEYV